MKRLTAKGVILSGLVLVLAIAGCRRKLSPEEFAKYLKIEHTLKVHAAPVLAVAYSPDGKVLISTDAEGKIIFWNPQTGEQIKIKSFFNDPVYQIAFSPDGKYLAFAGRGPAVLFYNPATLEPWDSFAAHSHNVLAIAWGPNRIFASASCAEKDPREFCIKGEVAVWKIEKDAARATELKRFLDHNDWVSSLAVSPNGKYLATGGLDNVINIYDTRTWQLLNTLQGHGARVDVLRFPPGNSELLVSASVDGTVRFWEIPDGKQKKILKSEGSSFAAMALSPDAKMVAAGGLDQKIVIWQIKNEKVVKSLEGLEDKISSLSFSPDGAALAAGLYDHNILVWKAKRPR